MNTAQGLGMQTMQGMYAGPGMEENTRLGYSPQTNPLLGMDNPYLNQAISNAQGDVTRNYQNVISPQISAMERGAGAFGNSGMQQYRQQSAQDLEKQLGNISTNMRMQDYGLQAQLGESDVARQLQAAQGNAALEEAMRGRQQGAYGDERGRQLQSMLFAPQFAESDYRDAQALLGTGDVLKNQQQSGLNYDYDQWLAQQQWPYQQLDVLANAIRTSMGGGGSTVTSSPNAYQSSPTAGAIGGGLAGYGIADQMGFSNPMLYGLGSGLLGGFI